MIQKIEILGVNVTNCDYSDLISIINSSIARNEKLMISYANTNSLNIAYSNKTFRNILNSEFTVHPDGAGIFFSSGLINKEKKLKSRFTGSDFYPILADYSIDHKWKIFFFGHKEHILNRIKLQYNRLNICGYAEGYNYNPAELIELINSKNPDILIVGLGQPLQEEFLVKYKVKLHCKVMIAVGDGIKVFAGEKIRGPEILQKAGLEWVVRLFLNPFKYWKRYIIGNHLFLYRIIRSKFTKFSN